ncbi:hypothetical protein H6B33_07780 [Gemmiger formicilis]|nr:hypothetical protein [Gemmiger formicilis]
MNLRKSFAISLAALVFLTGCADSASTLSALAEVSSSMEQSSPESAADVSEEETEMKLLVQIGDKTFTARWENNAAARALAERATDSAVIVELRDYGGFEKVGSLGENLPADDRQLTTQTGDIVLYNGNQIVLFYGSNSWSYTPLGHIEDLTGWKEALGKGDVTVRFSAME